VGGKREVPLCASERVRECMLMCMCLCVREQGRLE